MPRPWVAMIRSCSRGWIARSRTATFGRLPVNCAHCCAAVERDEEAQLGAEEEQVRIDEVLLDHVGVALHVGRGERLVQVLPKSVVLKT